MVTGTFAFCSVAGVSPPSEVVPKPTMSSSVPGAHRLAPPAPTTRVGVLVELRESLSTVMSLPEVAR